MHNRFNQFNIAIRLFMVLRHDLRSTWERDDNFPEGVKPVTTDENIANYIRHGKIDEPDWTIKPKHLEKVRGNLTALWEVVHILNSHLDDMDATFIQATIDRDMKDKGFDGLLKGFDITELLPNAIVDSEDTGFMIKKN